MGTRSTPARLVMLVYGFLAYAAFIACFLYLVFFLADAPLPYTVESGVRVGWPLALTIDLALLALFGVQHTIMARSGFKRAWTRILPEPIERSTFVLATVVCLTVIMLFWSPIAGHLWQVEAPWLRGLLWCVQGVGWVMVLASSFLIDHAELFGVSQVIAHLRGTPLPSRPFQTPLLYRYVRHPMMLGMLLALWSTPELTFSRLAFATGFTVYILLGVRIEERGLVETLGDDYRRYQRRVPQLLPRLAPRRRAAAPTTRGV